LGRRFILGDESPVAIATMRSRLLRDGVSPLVLESCGARPGTERAEIAVRPEGDAHIEVSLDCGAGAEPIAWSIELHAKKDGPFRADWHAERGTGRRPAPLPRLVVLPRSPRVRARVYFVDGKVATASASCATANRPRPTSMLEAPS